MMGRLGWAAVGLFVVAIAVLVGCGGSKAPVRTNISNNAFAFPDDEPNSGRVVLTVHWHKRSNRIIPPETDRLLVMLQRSNTTLMKQTVNRPISQSETTVIFEKVPIGEWVLVAEAYSGLEKIAEGRSNLFQVQANQTTTVAVELQPVTKLYTVQVVDNGRRIKLTLEYAAECVAVEIYRNTSPAVSTSLLNLIDIVDGQATREYYESDLAYHGTAKIEITPDTPTDRLPSLSRSITTGIGTGNGDITEEPFNYEKPFNHTPIQLGVHYWYVIRRINARRLPFSEAREPFELVYSPLSRPIGPVTPLAQLTQADLVEPTGDVDIGNVTFKFMSAQGADEYIIQVSDSSGFPSDRTVTIPLGYKLANPDIGGQVLTIPNQNLSGHFSAGQILYWRVGYRYSGDVNPPEGEWVFSQVRSFKPR